MNRSLKRRLSAAGVLVAIAIPLTGCSRGSDPTANSSAPTGNAAAEVKVDAAASKLLPAQMKDKGVSVAVYSDWSPEEYVEDGQLKGWNVDLAKAMAAKLGVDFKFHPSGFDNIIPGLDNGRYDMAVASLGVTPERLKSLDFVPTQKEGTAFGWKKGNTSVAVTKVKDACGRTVAVLTGAWEYDYLTEHNKEMCGDNLMKIQQFKDQPSAELAVTSGRVDLVAAGSGKLKYTATQTGQLEVSDLLVNAVYNGIGVPKGSKLGPALEAALQSVIDDGTYSKIRKDWGVTSRGDLKQAVLITK